MSRKRSRNQKAAQSAAPAKAAAVGSSPGVAVARYDGAGHGRRMRGWTPPHSGPNRSLVGIETLRARVRDTIRNDWAGAAGERVWTVNLVGTGIIPRPKTRDPQRKALYQRLWDTFAETSDADGVLDFYGQTTLVARSFISAGECFARERPRRADDGLTVPLQIQLLESEMLPHLDADTWPGLPHGHRIRQGIELNRIGKRAAYWFHREHPGDQPTGFGANDLVRVPADEVMHIYEPRRPGQLRGVSDFAPVLTRLRGILNMDDAVLERQMIANLFAVFYTRAAAEQAGTDPLTGQPVEYDDDGTPIAGMEPGSGVELPPGMDVKFSEPPDAGTNYGDFMRNANQGIAAGWGVPYELLTGDLRDVSDRALRVILNEFHRHCEQRQWQIFIPQWCQRVRNAWARACVLAGHIAPRDFAEAVSVTWSPHAWAYLHPVQDVEAKIKEFQAGFRSRSNIVADRGDDVEETDAERAEDAERERRLGLGHPPTGGTQ